MDESERKPSRFDQVRDFCADTSAHGLSRVAAAKSWPGRLFWMAVFLSASVFSIHQISKSFAAYFQYPTKTDFSITIKEQLHFPAVTVCNINPFKHSEIVKTAFWQAMVSIFFSGEVGGGLYFYLYFYITITLFRVVKNAVS